MIITLSSSEVTEAVHAYFASRFPSIDISDADVTLDNNEAVIEISPAADKPAARTTVKASKRSRKAAEPEVTAEEPEAEEAETVSVDAEDAPFEADTPATVEVKAEEPEEVVEPTGLADTDKPRKSIFG